MFAYLLSWVGEVGRDIINSWGLSDNDNKNIDLLVQKFGRRRHTARKKNNVFARYLFQERRQRQGKPFDSFVTDPRNVAKNCGYSDPYETKIILSQASCPRTSERKLLNQGETLIMEKALDIAATYKTTQQYLLSMAAIAEPADNVDSITMDTCLRFEAALIDYGHLFTSRGSSDRLWTPVYESIQL